MLGPGNHRHKAVMVRIPVVVVNGDGIALILRNKTSNGAILSGIEITTPNPTCAADPTVDLELSTNSGMSFATLAEDQAMDRFGRGDYTWTAAPQTDENEAMIRVTAAAVSPDESDEPFLIAPDGTQYFINDDDQTDDEIMGSAGLTMAVGNNANSGKTPDAPMSSIGTLLLAYDIEPGLHLCVRTSTSWVATTDKHGCLSLRNPVLDRATSDAP